MKIRLELNTHSGGTWLNYWGAYGEAVAKIEDNRLFVTHYDEEGNETNTQEVTLSQFFEMVKEAAKPPATGEEGGGA